jgi:hypothetical protein
MLRSLRISTCTVRHITGHFSSARRFDSLQSGVCDGMSILQGIDARDVGGPHILWIPTVVDATNGAPPAPGFAGGHARIKVPVIRLRSKGTVVLTCPPAKPGADGVFLGERSRSQVAWLILYFFFRESAGASSSTHPPLKFGSPSTRAS